MREKLACHSSRTSKGISVAWAMNDMCAGFHGHNTDAGQEDLPAPKAHARDGDLRVTGQMGCVSTKRLVW